MFFVHEKDVTERFFFSHEVQMVQAKMNLYLNIPVYSLISPTNIKYQNK